MQEKRGSFYNKIILMITCVTPLVYLPGRADGFYFPKIFLIYILVCLMLLHTLHHSQPVKLPSLKQLKITESLLLGYLILVVLSTIVSTDSTISIFGYPKREEGLLAILAYAGVYYFVKSYFDFREKTIEYMLITGALVAAYGILQSYGVDPLPRDADRFTWSARAFSTIGNPNFLGSYLALLIPFGSVFYIKYGKAKHLFLLGILYYALLVTYTRSAWLGTIFSILWIFFQTIRSKRNQWRQRLMIVTLLLATLTTVADYSLDGAIFGRFLTIGHDASKLVTDESNLDKLGSNRMFIWKRVVPLVYEKPMLGYGLETMGDVFDTYYHRDIIDEWGRLYRVDKAHNEYLHTAFSTGVPSVILYLLFQIGCLLKSAKRTASSEMDIAISAAIGGYMIQSCFNISVVSVAYMLWFIYGLSERKTDKKWVSI